MRLNGIDLAGYRSGDGEAFFSMLGTDVASVAALDGQTLTVTDDDRSTIEVFSGYVASSIIVDGATVGMKVIRALDDSSRQAIEALEQNVSAVRAIADEASTTAGEAKKSVSEMSSYIDSLLGLDGGDANAEP